jgi:hypothetical protein
MFQSLFKKKKPELAGVPAVRRMKTYSAESGYVYQYFYEGYRPYTSGSESGAEHVFQLSPDRKNWHSTSVFLADEAIKGWEAAHERTLNSTERYAIAKLALFHAFDERTAPALLKEDVRVRLADVEEIVETLGL